MNFDIIKMPLGQLSKNNLIEGYKALKLISELLEELKRKDNRNTRVQYHLKFNELSNRFYSNVPHIFGLSGIEPINNDQILKEKTKMVDSLLKMEVASPFITQEIQLTFIINHLKLS